LENADLRGANLKNANLAADSEDPPPLFDFARTYNQWTYFLPEVLDRQALGLTLVLSPVGDFNADDVLDDVDIATLRNKL